MEENFIKYLSENGIPILALMKKLNFREDDCMPTADELKKNLLKMDPDSYSAVVKFVYLFMEDKKVTWMI